MQKEKEQLLQLLPLLKEEKEKVGDPAKRQAITNPTKTIYSVKRFMGNSFDETSMESSVMEGESLAEEKEQLLQLFVEGGERKAKRQAITNPTKTIYSES